jgi:ZIP family zinc transporter
MSEAQTLLLGFVASATILLGLPVGKLGPPRLGLRQFLNAVAIGILLFLIWGVLVHAYEPVDAALGHFRDRTAGIGPALGYGALFLLGISAGLLSLVHYERWLAARGRPRRFGPGAMAAGELTSARAGLAGWSAARRRCLLIAVGIGLHNFGDGPAIGASAAAGAIGLATILVIGFALHNATEGFGIVAPLTTDGDRPSWGFLHPAARCGAQERPHGVAVLGSPAGPGSGIRHRHDRHRRRRLTRTQAPEPMLGDDLDRASSGRTRRRRRPPPKR